MDSLGYIGGGVLCVQLVPQIYKVYETKSANDLSYPFLMMHITGLSMMAVYGIHDENKPLYIPTLFSMFMTFVLINMKAYYMFNSYEVDV